MDCGMKQTIEKNKEAVSYLFWGGMTTLVSWGTYSFFATIIHLGHKTVTVANVLSWVCAVLFAFGTNKVWVFGSKDWSAKVVLPELWKFVVSRLATGLLELIGVPLLVTAGMDQMIFGITGMFAKILVSVIVVILNYVLSKVIVFQKSKGEKN